MAFTFTDFKEGGKKVISFVSKLLSRAVCVFDDIPFLLTIKDTGNIGPLLLVGAGLIIFPIEAYEGIKGLRKAYKRKMDRAERRALIGTSVAKLGLATLGFAASAALLAFILTNLVILSAVAAIAIPTVMAIVGGIELLQDVLCLHRTKLNHEDPTEAKREVAYSTAFFGFGLAIATLATLSVLTGLGVVSLGIIPSAILIAVVATALIVKIFQILDTKKVKDEHGKTTHIEHPLSDALANGWRKVKTLFGFAPTFEPAPQTNSDMINIHGALGGTAANAVRYDYPAPSEVETYTPIKVVVELTFDAAPVPAPRCVMV